jgi:hypothetical protein
MTAADCDCLQTPQSERLVEYLRGTSNGTSQKALRGVCKSLRKHPSCAIGRGMAFIVLRRSRNTRSYYLVESYRDEQGQTRRRTLCYLGREQDGTDTLAKALVHWQDAMARSQKELRKARGERRQVIRRRIEATRARISLITEHMQLLARAEAECRKREQQAEEELYWQSFERLRRSPTEENARSAKRAFLYLAKRHHPDQGGSHEGFIRLKNAYDRALNAWRRAAG